MGHSQRLLRSREDAKNKDVLIPLGLKMLKESNLFFNKLWTMSNPAWMAYLTENQGEHKSHGWSAGSGLHYGAVMGEKDGWTREKRSDSNAGRLRSHGEGVAQ